MVIATTVFIDNDKINSYSRQYDDIYEFFKNRWKEELEELEDFCTDNMLWDIQMLKLNLLNLIDTKTKPRIIVKGEPLYSIYSLSKGKLTELTREDLIVYLMRYILEF